MKQVFFSLVFFLFAAFVFGQDIEYKSITIDKVQNEYWIYKSQSEVGKTLLGIIDSKSSHTSPKSWCDALIPFAEKNAWQIIVPSDLNNLNLEQFVKALRTDSISKDFIFFSKDATIPSAFALVDLGISGVVMMPQDSLTALVSEVKVPVVVISNEESPEQSIGMIDLLQRKGHWVKTETAIDFQLEGHYQWFDEQLSWTDSIQKIVSDSVAFQLWSQDAGLLNEIPDVVRQGKMIELELKVSEPKQFTLDVLDLSANTVWKFEQFLGIGIHQIQIPTKKLDWGVYNIELRDNQLLNRSKIMIRG